MLANKRVFGFLGTVATSGAPMVNPMWVGIEGGEVVFNSEVGRLKTRQIERDPRVSLALVDLDDPYGYVELRGRVTRSVVGPEAEDGIDRLAKKYLDEDAYPWREPGKQRIKYWLDVESIAGE